MGSQTKKIKFNLISVVLCQVVTVAIGFILPRIYIENFGSAVNGVLSTIKQIFTYLCLLEAGVGLATSQALLKPVATGDKGRINSILAATKKHYTKIGFIYAAAVAVIGVVYCFFAKDIMNPATVIVLVLLNGIPSLITFFIQGKYCILLETDGMQYIITNSQTVLQTVSGLLKAAVLLLTDNLVLMQASYCLVASAQLIYVTLYARRHYKWLDFSADADFKAISQKNSVLVHQISAMVFNNTDILLLSFLSDFNTVSIYYIYNLFFSQVETFISSVVKGFNFALGQLFAVDTEAFTKKFRIYESLFVTANFVVYTAMCVFLLPLIQIYTSGIEDANYINPTLVLLFSTAKMISAAKTPASQIIEYSGSFNSTKWHAVCEMIINLTFTVAGILKWGICGALAGTVAAIVFRYAVTVWYTNKKILMRSPKESFLLLFINTCVFGIIYAVFNTTYFCNLGFWELCLNGVIHMLWIIPLYAFANFILRPDVYKNLILSLKGRKK